MRCIAFQLGEGRFALPMSDLVEVVPLLPVRALAHAPDGVAGVINYRGQVVPVIDLCQLALGRPSAERSSTRLLVLHWNPAGRESRLLALMVERAVNEQLIDADALTPPPVRIDATPYLGRLGMADGALVQLVDVSQLLPPSIGELLYAEARALP
jgi:chemotaxis-related protein WspB